MSPDLRAALATYNAGIARSREAYHRDKPDAHKEAAAAAQRKRYAKKRKKS